MKPLSDQQRLNLVESDQIYRAWREAVRRQHDYRYGMRWKPVNGAEYLIRLSDANGNGRSLGRRNPQTELIYEQFTTGKQVANEMYRGLTERLTTQQRMNRALRLGRLPTVVGDILSTLDQTNALKELRVVGTHALYAYEAMAAAQFKVDTKTNAGVDPRSDAAIKLTLLAPPLKGIGLLTALQKADKTFQVPELDKFRAVNKDGFMVDFITQDKGMTAAAPSKMVDEDLAAVEVPNLEWLANAPRIEQVVIAANGRPVLMPVADPRAFALHKAWLSQQHDREPVKKQRDLNQAKMLAGCLKEYLPNFPLEAEAIKQMKYLPKAMITQAMALIA